MYNPICRALQKALTIMAVGAALTCLPVHPNAAMAGDAPVAVKEGTIELGPVRIFYLDTGGKGEAVVLMHAGSGSAEAWRKYQLAPFAKAGYRVIAYDRRNYGKTIYDAASPPPGTTVDDLDAIRQHLGIDRFHIVATAAGGYVAVDYALSYPERLRSMVIANSIIGIKDDEYEAMGKRVRPEPFDKLPVEVKELSPSYRAANPEGLKEWLAIYTSSRVTPRGPDQPEKNVRTLKAMEGIKVPALFITGEADNYAPPPAYRKIQEHMPGAQFVTLREVNHSAYWERPEEFNNLVLDFLSKHR